MIINDKIDAKVTICFIFFKMLHFYLVLLFYEIFVENYFINLKFPEDFRCVTLDRIKRMLFSGNFYLGLLKILLENLFFYKKKAVTDHLFVSFFLGKKSKGTNSYQNAYTHS